MSARAEVRRLLDGTEPEPASVNGAARTTFETLFGFPIVKPVRWSQTLTTAIQVEGPNGEVIRWERQMDLATPKLLVLPVVSAGLHKNGKLPKQDLAVAIYAEIIGRCEAVEAADNAGEAAAWGEAVLNAAPEVQDISGHLDLRRGAGMDRMAGDAGRSADEPQRSRVVDAAGDQ